MLFRKTPRPSRHVAAPLRRFQPLLECLEDRLAPSVVTVTDNSDINGQLGGISPVRLSRIFTVTDNSDSSSDTGSLRYALDHLVVGSAALTNIINFATPQTITETTAGGGTLRIASGVTINGPVGGVTISGAGQFSVFTVTAGVSAVLSGLTITGGQANPSLPNTAGGITNNGTLSVKDCTFSGNSDSGIGGVNAGGILNNGGSLTVNDCTFSGNSATNPGAINAGAINNAGGSLTVNDSTFSGNSANSPWSGGISNRGTATLAGDILVGNTSHGIPDDIDGISLTNSRTTWWAWTKTTARLNTGSNTNNQLNVMLAGAGLGTLANWGGSTQTINLLPGSVAIGHGQLESGASTDQRGVPRPDDGSTHADAGAYQFSTPATVTVAAGDVNALIADLSSGTTSTINLTPSTYDFTTANNYWYGPDALPAISSTVTINGNGAVLERDPSLPLTTAGEMRFFYVSGGLSGLPAGSLTLNNLTLEGGYAKGGDSNQGGGGLGAGGAIFNQGTLSLNGVTLTNNTAQGGSNGVSTDGSGGGGIGQDAPLGGNGGGFGGAFPGGNGGSGGAAAASPWAAGGGGGGFSASANGVAGSMSGGAGGGPSGLGGGGGGIGSSPGRRRRRRRRRRRQARRPPPPSRRQEASAMAASASASLSAALSAAVGAAGSAVVAVLAAPSPWPAAAAAASAAAVASAGTASVVAAASAAAAVVSAAPPATASAALAAAMMAVGLGWAAPFSRCTATSPPSTRPSQKTVPTAATA